MKNGVLWEILAIFCAFCIVFEFWGEQKKRKKKKKKKKNGHARISIFFRPIVVLLIKFRKKSIIIGFRDLVFCFLWGKMD
jgi:hypothetical protein